jgi:hypothetical protein
MSRCKLRTPWPIHLAQLLELILFGEISIFFIPELWDLDYYSVLFQHKYCIHVNVPIHVHVDGAAVGEI